MQATHARKTFPCFDEPAMKAVFNVTVVHDRATVALSNSRDAGGFVRPGTARGCSIRRFECETSL